MSAIVVGASGAVGRLLLPHWQRDAASLLLQYRGAAAPWDRGACLQWSPVEGAEALESWAASHAPPPCMIVLAGVTPAGGQDLAMNAVVAGACLAAARRIGIRRVLVASSSAVYGDHLDRAFCEHDTPRPVNAYGKAKHGMEQACRQQAAPDIELTCLRIGNVAGADALLAQMGKAGKHQLAIDRYRDGGTPLRSYIGPGTLADILLQLALLPSRLPETLNVGAPRPVEMAALADAAGLRWQPRPRLDPAGQRITLDCGLLWSLLAPPPGVSDPAEMVRQIVFFNGSA